MKAEPARMQPVGNVVRQILHERGLTQGALGAAIGKTQQAVGAMLKAEPKLSMLVTIEDALDLPHGYIARRAGYVDEDLEVRDRIAVDPALEPEYQGNLVDFYDRAVDLSAQKRAAQAQDAKPSLEAVSVARTASRTKRTRASK